MKKNFLHLLACPDCSSALIQEDEYLTCTGCKHRFPVIQGAPNFLDNSEGATSTTIAFGEQWKLVQAGVFEPDGITYNIRNRSLMKQVLIPFPSANGKSRLILDGGCGTGEKLIEAARLFPNDQFIGVDAGDHLFSINHNSDMPPNLFLVRASLERLPLKAGLFDFVICHGVLHHLQDQPSGFSELSRACRPGGRISLWLYPELTDLRRSFARRCFSTYYFSRSIFANMAWKLGPKNCLWLAQLSSLIYLPYLLVFIMPKMNQALEEFEGEDHCPRTLMDQYRSTVFTLYDNLIPEIQNRYSVKKVKNMVDAFEDLKVTTYRDETREIFNQIPGFHLVKKTISHEQKL